ncbi:MAG TPA: MFS transporter [Xanthobacteraceae bacterium]|jgi:MFS family permease|nr:MFS transporter [Xanthobacteraceae bacterium]
MRNPDPDPKSMAASRNFVALSAVAIQLGVMFVGAILPTPLYPLYRQAFGFSGVTLTLIYATYVLGNLAALLLFGRLADQIGRRAASLPAVAVGIASTIVFAAAQGTGWLFAARALSGFSTGSRAARPRPGSPNFMAAAIAAAQPASPLEQIFSVVPPAH